jgi:hypothetical protein
LWKKSRVKDLLQTLARPRLTGSPGAQEVADVVHEHLSRLGYEIQDYPFTFSTWPGRFAVTVAGLLFLAGVVAAAVLMNMAHPGIALVVLLLTLLLAAAVAVLAVPLTDMLPAGKITANNMFAARPGSTPRYIFARAARLPWTSHHPRVAGLARIPHLRAADPARSRVAAR